MIETLDKRPIEDLELSARSHNSLKRAGIDTVGELRRAYGNGGIFRVRGLGKNSILEIRDKLGNYIESQQEESDG